MRMKIVSDGTSWGTKVVNEQTGEAIEGITRILWQVDPQELCSAFIEFIKIPLELKIDTQKIMTREKAFDTTAIGSHFKKYSVWPEH